MWMLIRWKAILAKANSKTRFIIYFESYEGWIDFYGDYQTLVLYNCMKRTKFSAIAKSFSLKAI